MESLLPISGNSNWNSALWELEWEKEGFGHLEWILKYILLWKAWQIRMSLYGQPVNQSCLTLCDPTDYTVHGILQARILEWVAFPFSRGSSQPRNQTQVSRTAGGFFTSWATREAHIGCIGQRIDAFELWCWRRLLKSPLDCKEIQPVHSEGDQPWDFFGRNAAKAETPVLWPPHEKSWLWKRPWSWEGLGAGGEGDDGGWDGWMASLTQ